MIRRIALLTAGMLLVSGLAFAQSTANANATVDILEPLIVNFAADLDFGVLGINANGPYTVDSAGVGTGAAAQQYGGTAAAAFTVTGASTRPFSFSVTQLVTDLTDGTQTIPFTTGNGYASCTACFLDGAGAATVTVGGQIGLTVGLTAGTFDAGVGNDAIQVTVAYN